MAPIGRLLPHAAAAVAGCALAATTFASRDAAAFCRTVTASVPAGYDPVSQGCFDAQGGPGIFVLYWRNLCVGYSLQKDASPLRKITLDQAQTIAAAAFAKWSDASCPGGGMPSVQASDEGPVDCTKVEYNSTAPNQHVILFRDDGWPYNDSSNTLGLTTVTYDTTDGEIYDADMELNSRDYNLVATSPAPSGSYDLASVITHEAGHFLGLAHSAYATAVMYAHYQPGASTPTPDDVAGICTIYPPGGQRSTTAGPLTADACDPTARHGFSSECGSQLLAEGGVPNPGGTSGGRESKCSVAGTPGAPGGASGMLVGLAVAGLLVRRARRRARGTRALAAAAGITLGATIAVGLPARDAHASVSVAAVFDDLVRASDAVARVTPVQQQALWEDGRIVTYTRMRVDARIAGELPQDTWVRTLGGAVGRIGQIVEGEPSFAIGQPSLVFLRTRTSGFEVTARAQGQFPIVADEGRPPRLASAQNPGTILPPAASAARLARDVLPGRSVEDVATEIAQEWARVHKKN